MLTREELYARRGEEEVLRLAGGSTDAVDRAIADAEAEATSYLLSKYGDLLPFSPEGTPDVLKTKLAALAHRFLARGPQVSPTLIEEARDVRSWLSKVASGAVSLGLGGSTTALDVDRAAPVVAHTAPRHQTLDFDFLRKW